MLPSERIASPQILKMGLLWAECIPLEWVLTDPDDSDVVVRNVFPWNEYLPTLMTVILWGRMCSPGMSTYQPWWRWYCEAECVPLGWVLTDPDDGDIVGQNVFPWDVYLPTLMTVILWGRMCSPGMSTYWPWWRWYCGAECVPLGWVLTDPDDGDVVGQNVFPWDEYKLRLCYTSLVDVHTTLLDDTLCINYQHHRSYIKYVLTNHKYTNNLKWPIVCYLI